jgi:serine/threonine protein kinase
MNYEEMLNAQEGVATHREKLPIGDFYRKKIEKKYRYVVELKPELADSIVFCEALKKEQQWSSKQMAKEQLHYELHEDSSGVYELELEQGSFLTLSQLIDQNPAVVAGKGFIDHFVESLLDFTSKLHAEGIQHVCYAPQNVFVRKGDNQPLLLCHGSFYYGVNDVNALYEGYEDYLAPEVMARETVDESSDVYSIGKLIAFIFDQCSMPYEYKAIVKKATDPSPAKRYKSIDAMKSAFAQKRASRRSLFMFAAAVVIALLAIFLYFDLMPQTTVVEFVEPAPKAEETDPFDTQFDPADDTLLMSDEDMMYQKKAEEIYRKRLQSGADAILSKVYNNERMSSSEKKFKASSQAMAEELLKLQQDLANEAGLSPEQAERIGSEIIERLTDEKVKSLTNKGYIKPKNDE